MTAKRRLEAGNASRIGLALSGGGFRASIFHLGVIRRLEELGIMPRVAVISTVSGGSIVGAYYAIEMERYLRTVKPGSWTDREVRCSGWEAIAGRFLEAVDHNIRSRALVFTPFYHPILFATSVALAPFRKAARSILIQAEYDRWFYDDGTLDELPSVTPMSSPASGTVLTGPKLVLNTTSLNTGERRAFSRDANTRLGDLKTSNKNVLKLSRVVGASSGVPVLFPPTAVAEDLLVDGGVADNQGIEGLRDNGCDVMIVSDASGQLELSHQQGTSEAAVFVRVNGILQHQVRNKLLDELDREYHDRRETGAPLTFAFFHLYLNLKDDPAISHRLSSEYIQPTARIRTDLDQFSYVEREALLYHGYTLADAMVRKWCPGLLPSQGTGVLPLRVPPLFQETVQRDPDRRRWIKAELESGHQKLFLLRSLEKFPLQAATLGLLHALAFAASLPFTLWAVWPLRDAIRKWLQGGAVGSVIDAVAGLGETSLAWVKLLARLAAGAPLVGRFVPSADRLDQLTPPTAGQLAAFTASLADLLGLLALALLLGYVVFFPFWAWLRRWVVALDRRRYRDLTGLPEWGLDWNVESRPPEPEEPKSRVQRWKRFILRKILRRRY